MKCSSGTYIPSKGGRDHDSLSSVVLFSTQYCNPLMQGPESKVEIIRNYTIDSWTENT